jgi:hypothetical protein
MQRLEASSAVRHIYMSLVGKGLRKIMKSVEVVQPLYRVYLKSLDTLQEWVLHIKTRKYAHTHICPEISGTLISLKEFILQ